jgi:hypothetical protein
MRILRVLLVTSIALAVAVGTAPLAAGKTGDKARAREALLREADLPQVGGQWSSTPRNSEGDSEADAIRKEIFECSSVQRVLDRSKKFRVLGPNFTRSTPQGDQQVSDTVYVFPNVKAARSYMAPFLDDDGIDCFRKYLLEQLQNRVQGAEVLVQSVERAPELGDSSVGYQLTATISDDAGNEDVIHYDAYAIRVGRGVTGLSFANQNQPFPGLEGVNEAATERLENAL